MLPLHLPLVMLALPMPLVPTPGLPLLESTLLPFASVQKRAMRSKYSTRV